EALELGTKAVEFRQKILGNEHRDTLTSMAHLSDCFLEIGNHDEALRLALKVLNIRQRVLGIEHPDTKWSLESV
ncbi:hypothetical protein CPB86DRAFT_673494, partial [Serendipita vermifera]